jgi:hypothetical protein
MAESVLHFVRKQQQQIFHAVLFETQICCAQRRTTANTTIATFADDTALLATDSDPALASQLLQHHLDLLQEWFHKWKIRINQTKSSQITFTTKSTHCPPVTINNSQIPIQTEVKYLGLYLDQKLNLADAHQDKTPTSRPKSTTDVMAFRTKIQTQPKKQIFGLHMHNKTDFDVRNSTVGVC